MSLKTKTYIALVLAAGATALTHALGQWNSDHLVRFFCYLALAVPASGLKVALPGITGTMSVSYVFLLAGVTELGLAQAVVIGIICFTVQSLWHAKRRPKLIQVLFGVANGAVVITATDYVYRSPWTSTAFLQAPFRLAIAASVYFVVNTFPVAMVIALTERKSLRQVWSSCYFWSFPYYLVGAAIVGALSFANRMLDWQAGVLILPVVYAIYRSYHLYLDQLQSERKHAEEVASLHTKTMAALDSAISANAKLEAVIQASPLAILAIDRDASVTSWNLMAERILGWSPEEAIGRRLRIAEGRSEDVIVDIIERTLNGEQISGMETTQWRKDGSPFDAAIWTAPLRDRERISGVLITIADVSDHKRLEEQLRLSQKMEAVGRLAGGIAHDFNNLLTVINGYSAMLVDSLRENRYAAGQASDILAAGTRAAELVSQLLSFSRRQILKPKTIEINQLVKDVDRMLRRIIGEHIQITTSLQPDAGRIHADVNQMEAVLLNLATNARDAMPLGGILSIQTSHVDLTADRQRRQPDLPAGSYVCLVVSDTGHGMDAETQQHIFEPFFTTKQRGKGTGLGLSSAYGSIVQSGGHILVASQPERGTIFSIYLPRIESANAYEAPTQHSSQTCHGSETILLVEDEGAVRRMLREALNRAGYRVWEAANGAEAIEQNAAQIEKVDLVVTDVVMPVMNGLKMAAELHTKRPDLKVIFMSGHSEEFLTTQGRTDTTRDLLQKPFIPEVLVRKVREVLDHGWGRVSRSAPVRPITAGIRKPNSAA